MDTLLQSLIERFAWRPRLRHPQVTNHHNLRVFRRDVLTKVIRTLKRDSSQTTNG